MTGQLIGRHTGADGRRVNLNGGTVHGADLCAHIFQNMNNRGNVGDVGNIFNAANAVGKNCCRYNRHGGVLGPADQHFAGQPPPAGNHKFVQFGTLQSNFYGCIIMRMEQENIYVNQKKKISSTGLKKAGNQYFTQRNPYSFR